MRGQDHIVIDDFRGDWDRGEIFSVPPGYFAKNGADPGPFINLPSLNITFNEKGFKTRNGFDPIGKVPTNFSTNTIRQGEVYPILNQTARYIIQDALGQLWDKTFSEAVPFRGVLANTVRTACATINNRWYYNRHNEQYGLENLQYYEGVSSRPAAGAGPGAGTSPGAADGAAGKVEAGVHLFAVVWETVSGFYTKPSPVAVWTAGGAKKINLTSVVVGGGSVVARHIVASKRIVDYTGISQDYELFFVPDGTINDNVTTTITVDFYDSDLVSSADYLLDQLDDIPGGLGMLEYNGRLVIWGINGNESLLRISEQDEYESFSDLVGFKEIAKGNGGAIMCCAVLDGQLYIFKRKRTFVLYDNGEEPVYWPYNEVDSGLGSGFYGVGEVNDVRGTHRSVLIVGNPSGLFVFNGQFAPVPLSYPIDSRWKDGSVGTINDRLEIQVDTQGEKIYILPHVSTSVFSYYMWVCDFSEGYGANQVKWTTWNYFNPGLGDGQQITSILADSISPPIITTERSVTGFDSQFGRIYNNSLNQDQPAGESVSAIYNYARTGYLTLGTKGELVNFIGTRLRVTGSGSLLISLHGLDGTPQSSGITLTLATRPGKLLKALHNFTSEYAQILFSITNAANQDRFQLNRIILFGNIVADDRPA